MRGVNFGWEKMKIQVFDCRGIFYKVGVWLRCPKRLNLKNVRVCGRFLEFKRVSWWFFRGGVMIIKNEIKSI